MLQQTIALIIIAIFLIRLIWQKQKKQIPRNEFFFWFLFWLLAAGAIAGIKWIDKIVAKLGFSGSGIDILLYFGIIILFYLIFKIRIKQEKQNREITEIVRKISLKE